MFLYNIFPPEFIKIGLEAEDKEEVFEEMVDLLCQNRKNVDRREILDVIRKREYKMSTGIYTGIAIPHGKSTTIDAIHGILGISRKGIDYDALDGKPVYLVFMLLAPLVDSEEHLRFLKRLALLVENPDFYSDIIAQKNPRDVNGILKKYEDIYIASE